MASITHAERRMEIGITTDVELLLLWPSVGEGMSWLYSTCCGYTCVLTCKRAYMRLLTCIHSHTHAYVNVRMYTRTFTYTHIQVIRMCTHTHTHTPHAHTTHHTHHTHRTHHIPHTPPLFTMSTGDVGPPRSRPPGYP